MEETREEKNEYSYSVPCQVGTNESQYNLIQSSTMH